ncbi:MAG TPA: 6,7-dimethyl-8-ribityllumazine synthase [Reyranella sp.]|nr:6,7-dimethyl-8-ribityllumazine synthase [Reyranella sp.]
MVVTSSGVSVSPGSAKDRRFLIVEARFYENVADELLAGAKAALTEAGASFDVVTVPGSLEVPAAIAMAIGTGYDGFVALGCVIRGETMHFEIVSNESARALMDLAVGRGIAIGNGILTVSNESQAMARARLSEQDKGGGAARAALVMAALKAKLASK